MQYDTTTRKFKKVGDEKGQPQDKEFIGIERRQFDKLVDFAKKDGFDLNGDTKQAKTIRSRRAACQYISVALDEFIANRESK